MMTRKEMYDHYRLEDPRIPPLSEYIKEDRRPYFTGVPVNFYLKAHTPITDSSDEGGGRLGGDNGRRFMLPAIRYGKPPIGTADPTLSECHHTKEWALIASIDGGEVADKHKVQLVGKHELEKVATWNKETFIAGVATQPYGAGLGKFTAKFNPDEPYSATIAIEKGTHDEHGAAIFFEQGVRRCLLTRRLYGLSDDQALWHMMMDWAHFRPSRSKPRRDPGQLFFPDQCSHIFERYWDVLCDPVQHPEFPDFQETDKTISYMQAMTIGISGMSLGNWVPLPEAQAPEKSIRVAHTAALSRRCPIQDASDYWGTLEDQAKEEAAMIEAKCIKGKSSPDSEGVSLDGISIDGTESGPSTAGPSGP
jgi:hypothetical protein